MNAMTNLEHLNAQLLDWLAGHDIEHEVHQHAQAFTGLETARAEGVDPETFAKVVGVATEGDRRALMVLDATDHLDLRKARLTLGAGDVRLLSEAELTMLAPDCETGAMPAVGELYGLPTYADFAVREDPQISFNAGGHRFSVRVDRAAWERAAAVHYADLAEDTDLRPAWAPS